MTQRLVVFLMVGGVAGFGAVFLAVPGLVLGLVVLAIIAGRYRAADVLPAGSYLLGFGLVGWSLVGPAVRGAGGFLFLNAWLLVYGYAALAVAGAVLIAYETMLRLLRRRPPRVAGRR